MACDGEALGPAAIETVMNSADVVRAAGPQDIVGHLPRLRERQQVPTRKHVDLDAEAVSCHLAPQGDPQTARSTIKLVTARAAPAVATIGLAGTSVTLMTM